MTFVFVKPAPDLPAAAAKILKSDPIGSGLNGVGLLDAAGNVPDVGMAWPAGGLTMRLLADGVIKLADDPVFAKPAPAPVAAPASAPAPTTVEPTPAH